MPRLRKLVQFVIVSLPSLFILLWTFDAALVPGTDVFLIALLQVLLIGVFIWRWHVPRSAFEHAAE